MQLFCARDSSVDVTVRVLDGQYYQEVADDPEEVVRHYATSTSQVILFSVFCDLFTALLHKLLSCKRD